MQPITTVIDPMGVFIVHKQTSGALTAEVSPAWLMLGIPGALCLAGLVAAGFALAEDSTKLRRRLFEAQLELGAADQEALEKEGTE